MIAGTASSAALGRSKPIHRGNSPTLSAPANKNLRAKLATVDEQAIAHHKLRTLEFLIATDTISENCLTRSVHATCSVSNRNKNACFVPNTKNREAGRRSLFSSERRISRYDTGAAPTQMSSPHPIHLLDALFTTDDMREIFSDHRRLQSMLNFEAALARALARAGVAPKDLVAAIEAKCDANLFSIETLAREAALAGNIAIPMVKHLTSLVAKSDEKGASFVHYGATSQDAIDTGLVLQLREALEVIGDGLSKISSALVKLVEAHGSTLVVGRTWLQHAPPVTLGLKAAGWLSAIERHHARLNQTQKDVLVIQFGGAVGTLAALGDRGPAVASALADDLKLGLPDLPWHSHRDRIVEVATTLGLLVGTLGKIARDISLMAQTEVGELAEPAALGRGGSSTMPHKQNPVGCAVILSAAIRVPALVSTMLSSMVQEHERGLGGWHAEWETLPEICMLAAGAVAHMAQIIPGLEIHENRMAENINATHGLIFAEAVAMVLRKHMDRSQAHELLEYASQRAVTEKRSLREVLLDDAKIRKHLSAEDIARLTDAKNYTGSAEQTAKKVLSSLDRKL
jgi:3-carboxy-cis,cis-muconate cycloisomerase